MQISLFSISSPLHRDLPALEEDLFIKDIERALGALFSICGSDFSSYETAASSVIYVRTGGTEGIFKSLGLKGSFGPKWALGLKGAFGPKGVLGQNETFRLLTSGKSNSLAAAMEILSYINVSGGNGEILHGSPEYIAGRLLKGESSLRPMPAFNPGAALRPMPSVNLCGARLGVIGRPSDWLISSDVDYEAVRDKFSATLVDIDIDELVEDVRSSGCDLRSFEGSEAIHKSLLGMVDRYRLDGLTLRCFDLLDAIGNTGCLALARLNAAGIPSSCEGDIPALLSMMVAFRQTGCPGFQCNLSRIEGDELLFAHCTVPLSMVKNYSYATHFESGIGTAIKGELPEGDYTIFKISPSLDQMALIPATLVRNESKPLLCRTQIVLRAAGAADYFLHSPLANHHIILPGRLDLRELNTRESLASVQKRSISCSLTNESKRAVASLK